MAWRYHGKTFIAAERSDIFPLISTSDGFLKWFLRKCELDTTPGGLFKMVWANDTTVNATFLEIKPNERFSFSWKFTELGFSTRIDLWLESTENGTIFHIEEGDFPEDIRNVPMYREITQGWTEFVFNLKSVIQYSHDLRDEWT